jgi:Spy/CpxP family protein refolding chaperone
MRKSLLSLSLVLTLASAPALFAQTSASTNAPSATAPSGDESNGQRGEKLKALLEQLDLSDAQKQQIQQIRANTQPGKERRQQIMTVLTPDQKQKLISMLQKYRAEQAGQ